MGLEVLWFEKIPPKGKEKQPFFVFSEVIFFGIFFVQVWGNLGKNPSLPQKFAWSYTDGAIFTLRFGWCS